MNHGFLRSRLEEPEELLGRIRRHFGGEVVALDDDAALPQVAEALLKKGVANVIITLGSKGAYFQNADSYFHVAAPQVTAVDTTAAGDIFNGALAVALAEGKDWQPAIDFACQAGAIAVTRMGAQASAPYRDELFVRVK